MTTTTPKRTRRDKITIYDLGGSTSQFLPFPLPTGKHGVMQIEHERRPKGSRMPVVSMRNAIFMGLKPTTLIISEPVIVHKLIEVRGKDRGTWMTTYPQEIEQCDRQTKRFKGHVLVGGLGLGFAAAKLLMNPRVDKVTVVEISDDVNKLVWPSLQRLSHYLLKDIELVHDDLFEYLKKAKANGTKFDYAFLDTWCPTGQHVLTTDVMPLRRLCIDVVKQKNIECWNEDEMIGQVAMGAHTRAMMLRPDAPDYGFFTVSDDDFALGRKGNAETFPFMNYLRQNRASLDFNVAAAMAEKYVKDMKDIVRFDKVWGKYF